LRGTWAGISRIELETLPQGLNRDQIDEQAKSGIDD
jgi:hypothetical protein